MIINKITNCIEKKEKHTHNCFYFSRFTIQDREKFIREYLILPQMQNYYANITYYNYSKTIIIALNCKNAP